MFSLPFGDVSGGLSLGFLPLFFPFVLFFFSSLLEESCSLLFFFRLVSEEVRNQFCAHGVTPALVMTILGLASSHTAHAWTTSWPHWYHCPAGQC